MICLDAVERISPDQYKVVGLWLISLSLNEIAYLSVYENGDLVKFMIMKIKFTGALICQMKDAEIAVEISSFVIRKHRRSSCCLFGRSFSQYTALFAI